MSEDPEWECGMRYIQERTGRETSVGLTIAAKLGETRKQRRLSLQDVADRARLSKSHIWEIEQGRSINPTISAAIAIASALGVSLDYLCGLSTTLPNLHPEALRIACEVDALIRKTDVSESRAAAADLDNPNTFHMQPETP